MADEATDVKDSNEITLDDFNADEQAADKAAPSPAKETKAEKPDKVEEKPEGEDTKDEVKLPDVPTKGEEDKPKEDEGEVVPPEDKPTKADERKTQLNTEIRDLVAQRNALKDEVTKANAEVYQPATEQDLVDEGLSATDAKVEALRQQIEVRDYNERVSEAQLTIESEANRVLTDFEWANPDSPTYKEELSKEASQLLESNLITDPNTGQVIGSNVSPYQLYKTLDRASGISSVEGQLKGQQNTEQMLANADTASSAAPPKKPVDALMELWKSDD